MVVHVLISNDQEFKACLDFMRLCLKTTTIKTTKKTFSANLFRLTSYIYEP